MLIIPNYIKKAKIINAPIKYKWDDKKDFDGYYLKPNRALDKQLSQISDRAVFALTLGMAEWVAWRLQNEAEQIKMFNYLEAGWATVVDWNYYNKEAVRSWNFNKKGREWQPLEYIRQKITAIVVPFAQDEPFNEDCVCISQMATHVLPNSTPFKKWRQQIVKRLSQTNPFDQNDYLGLPLSREAMDPNLKYKPGMSKKLINDFLQSLDYKKNIFLNSPTQMKKLGFKGVPYSLK